MRQTFLPMLLIFCSWQTQDKIVLKTQDGNNVIVSKDVIRYNDKIISGQIIGIIYGSKYNKLIEQNGTVLLFLEIDNRPNFNNLAAYRLTKQKATKIIECVYNDRNQGIGPAPFTDMDGDGKLEFGGFDITEHYDSKDSMYYNPSQYYEISNGIIKSDSVLTIKMDRKINGVYLSKQLDKAGNCCVVVKKMIAKSSR